MDAIVYLREEHSKVRKMLHKISNTSNEKTKVKLFTTLCQDLSKHEKTEEIVWYPVLRKDKDMRDIIQHLVAEEKSASKVKILQI
jgi:iron-sulfur cluster repair protein YtfE (RIC family)